MHVDRFYLLVLTYPFPHQVILPNPIALSQMVEVERTERLQN